jgi:RNA polymerase sigma-70 factor (ECF subfamily)
MPASRIAITTLITVRRWHRDQIAEGLELVENALGRGARGPYALQAAIAALHAQAKSAQETDWHQIAALYELLWQVQPSPVVELNRAVAVAMASGWSEGLVLLDALQERGELRGYYLLPAARGDLLRRMERWKQSGEAYLQALALVSNEAERKFLQEDWRKCRARFDDHCLKRDAYNTWATRLLERSPGAAGR